MEGILTSVTQTNGRYFKDVTQSAWRATKGGNGIAFQGPAWYFNAVTQVSMGM